MRVPLRFLFLSSLLVLPLVGGACESQAPSGPPCKTSDDCAAGEVCSDGRCKPQVHPKDAGEEPKGDGGVITLPDGGTTDAGSRPDASITDPTNPNKDTDCDGLTDAEEFANTYGSGREKTDPNNADTDGDGILDGVEAGRASSVDPFCPTFEGDLDPGSHTSPVNADTDGDGLADGIEDKNHNGKLDPGETDPTRSDSDGDGLSDRVEDRNGNGVVDPGETDPLLVDTDGDGLLDGIEVNAAHTDPTKVDTDGDGCSDGIEDKNHNGVIDSGESDPNNPGDCAGAGRDTDADGLTDDVEISVTHTDPRRPDTDGDGLLDGDEDRNGNGTVDPGETNPLRADSDCDGLSDFLELRGFRTNPLVADTDGDGLLDGIEAGAVLNPDPTHCTSFIADADPASRSSPLLADTDCDGLSDGAEDANHDGSLNAGESDPSRRDTDGDGLTDGVEKGACTNLDTANCPSFSADTDCGATTTDARAPDTDGDGMTDGQEDVNRNGQVDSGESDPNRSDTDCDGIGDAEERAFFRTDPALADTDHDGLVDGLEIGRTSSPDPSCTFVADSDPATRTLPYSSDSDGDGLADGVEDANHNGRVDTGETDPNVSDTDGDGLADGIEDRNHDGVRDASETDPLASDTDSDGIPDGIEDLNHNGSRDPGETNALAADSDGDGCSDGEEDRNWNHMVDPGETNPLVGGDCPLPTSVDSDCDGLSDEVETTVTHTDLHVADTDGDGITDGIEAGAVFNPNPVACTGFVADADPSRVTDPTRIDTDCDGLTDGQEDLNHNGRVDTGETDPSNPDTDGDGLRDGVERGVTTNPDPTHCPGFVADADASSTTDPLNPDSDGDGVLDGTEDSNQNGAVDPSELNPNSGGDVTAPDQQACSAANLRAVEMIARAAQEADLTVATSPSFLATHTTTVRSGGVDRGAMFFDPAGQVAGFAIKLAGAPAGADITAQLSTIEGQLGGAGTLGEKFVQAITTWDGYVAALAQYTFSDSSSGDKVGKSANDLVGRVLSNPSGLLSGAALGTEAGPYRLKLQLVRRSASSFVLVGALTSSAAMTEARSFAVDDLTNGSALAQGSDTTGVQCDRMLVQARQKVDFLWVVDNSGSMDNEQQAVRTAAQAMANQLSGSTVDWRLGVIVSDTDNITNSVSSWNNIAYPNASRPRYCAFTRNATDFQNCMGKLGTSGSGTERFFRPVACMMGAGSSLTPYTYNCGRYSYLQPPGSYPMLSRSQTETPDKLRAGARLGVIFLTDANEQSDGDYIASNSNPVPSGSLTKIPDWVSFFRNFDGQGTAESEAFVGGIVCPAGGDCSDENTSNYMNTRWPTFFAQANGVYADLPNDSDSQQAQKIQNAVTLILDTAIGQVSPYLLAKPPISSTLKVATDAVLEGSCNASDIPRSRVNGFDYDGATRSIKFYGACRPRSDQVGKRISVSYRYWVDRTPDPDGSAPPCGGPCPDPQVCDPVTDQCTCPSDCGGTCGAQEVCNVATCQCVCPPGCGGRCTGNETCNSSTCSCECNQNITCGVGFRFDTNACACVCDTGALACGAGTVADPQTCTCQCEPDCGGLCADPRVCNQSTCSCGCNPNKICPANQVVDPTSCSCVCDPTSIVCPANQEPDPVSCGCKCKSDCGGTCGTGTGLTCDPSSCNCVCDASAPCGPGLKRDPNTCACVCDVDQLDCEAPLVADAVACACLCAPDCSYEGFAGCTGGTSCDPASCSCRCNLTCPAGTQLDEQACACVCDTAALDCASLGDTFEADPDTCSCVCKPDCGGCPSGGRCDLSYCRCRTGPQ